MTRRERRDVAVIGAGPAGSAAAIAAVRRGMSVLLIDRAEHPRYKVCGGCLAPAGIHVLRTLRANQILSGALPLTRICLRAAEHETTLRISTGCAIVRPHFDHRMVQLAESLGVECWTSTSAAVQSEGVLRLHRYGDTLGIRARVIIAADGLAGTSLAADPAFGWRVSLRNRMGFGAIVPSDSIRCRVGEVLMHVHRNGYVGVTAAPGGGLNIAAAVDPSHVRALGGTAGCVLDILGDAVRDRDSLLRTPWKGTPLLNRARRCVAAPTVLVAGDAAGYVEPFTGEGMSWALATGAAAGAHAASIVRDGAPWRDWIGIHRALMSRSLRRCRVISSLIRRPLLAQGAVRLSRIMPGPLERIAATLGQPLQASITESVP